MGSGKERRPPMSKEPDILPEDHEQYERDYYDQESGNAARGCLNAFKILLLIIAAALVGLLISCASVKHPPVTVATGVVISVDGDHVLVAFEVINRSTGSQTSNWFYCPKHTYQKGDRYPDPSKYQDKP